MGRSSFPLSLLIVVLPCSPLPLLLASLAASCKLFLSEFPLFILLLFHVKLKKNLEEKRINIHSNFLLLANDSTLDCVTDTFNTHASTFSRVILMQPTQTSKFTVKSESKKTKRNYNISRKLIMLDI